MFGKKLAESSQVGGPLAAERDCPELVLRTVGGTPAERFYQERGFVEEARWDWWFGRVQVQLRRRL